MEAIYFRQKYDDFDAEPIDFKLTSPSSMLLIRIKLKE
jgi:hypothetical protein